MKNFTDEELVELADYAEEQERSTLNPDEKKAWGAIRQGADWLMRFRIKAKKNQLESAGERKNVPVKPQ
jgi:hypothetical protein